MIRKNKRLYIITAIFEKTLKNKKLQESDLTVQYQTLQSFKNIKDLQSKEFHEFIIMKNYIRKFVQLNTKTSEESRYNNPQSTKARITR